MRKFRIDPWKDEDYPGLVRYLTVATLVRRCRPTQALRVAGLSIAGESLDDIGRAR